MDGQSYTCQTDGEDNITPWGMTVAWKTVDPHIVGDDREDQR
jgi:hypothetical protein